MSNNKAFLGVNLDLLENPKYEKLDSRAMMLYALYADRYSASLNNARLGNTAFVDDMGVFIRFTNELAAKVLHVSKQKVTDFRKALVDLDLIKVVREGLKGYKIYVYPVQQTPKETELLLPWKNHTISVQKEVASWTTFAKIEFCKNLKITAQTVDMTVSRNSESTCSQKSITSLSHSSLSHVSVYNNGLDDHARTREVGINPKTNSYNTLPDEIKKSYARTFGFITQPMANELHTLIKKSNAEMVSYVINSAYGRKISNAINYIKAAISNAIKRGDKCAQDMINYYERVKSRYSQRGTNRYMSDEEVESRFKEEEKALEKDNPTLFKRLQQIKQNSANRSKQRPLIPVFNIFEENTPEIPIF